MRLKKLLLFVIMLVNLLEMSHGQGAMQEKSTSFHQFDQCSW
jgi:hypothetical protein